MKKNIYLSLVATIFATIFNSCEPQEHGKNIEITNTNLYLFGIVDEYLPNINEFVLIGMTNNLTLNDTTGKVTGSGYGIELHFLSYLNETCCPISQQTVISNITMDEAFENPSLLEVGKCTGGIYKFENGEQVDVIIKDVNLTIKENSTQEKMEYQIEATIDNEKIIFTFNGNPTKDYQIKEIDIETEVINENIIFDVNEIDYNCETILNNKKQNTISIYLESEKYVGFFICYASPENNTKEGIYGKYIVSKEHNIGTASQSPGVETFMFEGEIEMYPYPSMLSKYDFTTDTESLFIVKEGYIEIKKDKISFEITSCKGSKIKGTTEGELDIMSEEERFGDWNYAPKKTQHQKSPKNQVPTKRERPSLLKK